jgi:hypothetical protein
MKQSLKLVSIRPEGNRYAVVLRTATDWRLTLSVPADTLYDSIRFVTAVERQTGRKVWLGAAPGDQDSWLCWLRYKMQDPQKED